MYWADGRPNRCEPKSGGVLCRGERSPDCVFLYGSEVDYVPIEQLVWIEYDPVARRFTRRDTLPAPFASIGAYDPSRLIVDRGLPENARILLDRPAGSVN